MEKRVTLAFVLCIGIVFGYQWLMAKLYPSPARGSTPPADVADPAPVDSSQAPKEPTPAPGAGGGTAATALPPIVKETDRLVIEFSNVGASIVRVTLKDYFNTVGVKRGTPAALDPENWLTLYDFADTGKRLLATRFGDTPKFAEAIDQLPWEQVSTDPPTFRFESGSGMKIEKRYQVVPGQYYVDVTIDITPTDPQGTNDLLLTSAAGLRHEGRAAYARGVSAVLGVREGEDHNTFVFHDARSLSSKPVIDQFESGRNATFVGSVNTFFGILLAIDPTDIGSVESTLSEALIDEALVRKGMAAAEQEGVALSVAQLEALRTSSRNTVSQETKLALTRAKPHQFRLFTGPKESDLMQGPIYGVFDPWVQADYHNLAWINRGLLQMLRWLHGWVGNWGVAIILLTILVRGTLFPINRYQSKRMGEFQKKMAKLKPELDELKQRYKNNPRKFQESQMKLMREHQAQPPVLGCLVTLLPIPIFFGLFQVLGTAIELRHSEFFGWVKDLSQPDALPLPFSLPLIGSTLNVLPILMMITWFLQTLMTPKPTDPQQAQMMKMMSIMPFVMAFFLYNYAAGLSLYMVVSSLLAMIQIKFLHVTTPSAA